MNSLPLVTVGAIHYNNEKYVIEALESIKNQTYPNIELLIVDDCSTDSSIALIKEWLKTYDKPYRLIQHEKNLGVAYTCSTAMENATGKYFSGLSTDDLYLPDKTQLQVDILENSADDVAAVYSDAYFIKEDGAPRYGRFIQWTRDFEDAPTGDIFEPLLQGCFIAGMTVLLKMEHYRKVGPYDVTLAYEDFDFYLRIAKEYKFIFSDYVSVKYRRRSGSQLNTIKKWNPSNIRIYLKHIDRPVVMTNLRWYAKKVYTEGDEESYKILAASPVSNDPFIKTALRLMKFKVPGPFGRRLLNRLFPYSAGWWY